MFDWNEPYQWVMRMKREYEEVTGIAGRYDLYEWASVLNNPDYDRFLENIHITQFHEFVLLKYNLIQLHKNKEAFDAPESMYQECRSVVIDLAQEELVLTPFKKFFNLNEVVQTQLPVILEKLAHASVVEIMDKLDGSMQSARFYHGKVFMSGSSAIDPEESWRLRDGLSYLMDGYRQLLKDYADYTVNFEYIGPKNPHVVAYKEEEAGLYVIGMRHVYTGRQLSYTEVSDIVRRYEEVKMVAFESLSFQELLQKMKEYQGYEKEGWVVNIDGQLLKIKCDDYVDIHWTLSGVLSMNTVIKHIAENTLDDFLSKIPAHYQKRVREVAQGVYHYMAAVEEKVEAYFVKAPKEDRKTFMLWVEKHVEKDLVDYVKMRFVNRPYHPLKSRYRYKKAKEMGLGGGETTIFTDEI